MREDQDKPEIPKLLPQCLPPSLSTPTQEGGCARLHVGERGFESFCQLTSVIMLTWTPFFSQALFCHSRTEQKLCYDSDLTVLANSSQGPPEPYSHQIHLYLPSERRVGGGSWGHKHTSTPACTYRWGWNNPKYCSSASL